MTTYHTMNPLGSVDVKDLYDNAQNLDVAVNDVENREWVDRLGVSRKSWWGMEQDFQDFLINSGYESLGDYAAGIEITTRNQFVWKDGELYRVDDSVALPYTTTGDWATESANFVAIGDRVLRQALADTSDPANGAALVGYKAPYAGAIAQTQANKNSQTLNTKDFGASAANTEAENRTALQAAIAAADAMGGGVVIVDRDASYGLKRSDVTTLPDFSAVTTSMTVVDYSLNSSYGFPEGNDGAQIRYFQYTHDPLGVHQHDGNTMWLRGPWHPSFAISVDQGETTENRKGSVLFLADGAAKWQVASTGEWDKTTGEDTIDFEISVYGDYANRGVMSGATLFRIRRSDGAISFNGGVGVDESYRFRSEILGTAISSFVAQGDHSVRLDFRNLTSGLLGFISADASGLSFRSGSVERVRFGTDGSIYGNFARVQQKTVNNTVSVSESNAIFSNSDATGGFVFTLPPPAVGLVYTFVCTSANNLRVAPTSGTFRGAGANKYKQTSSIGSLLKIFCVTPGFWEVEVEKGTWTTEP